MTQALVASAAPAVPGSVLAHGRRFGAADKVKLACIGIGNRGGEIIRELHKTGLANIVALCDVDMEAPHTLDIIKMFPNVPRFQDFRQMFDKMGKEIEAVSVGVPESKIFSWSSC